MAKRSSSSIFRPAGFRRSRCPTRPICSAIRLCDSLCSIGQPIAFVQDCRTMHDGIVNQPEPHSADGWDEWQLTYRFGVLLIFPPEPLRSVVNDLRGRYDPRSQSFCDAHISLTGPAPRAPSEAEWAALEDAASKVAPFSIRYGPLKTLPPHPGVTLAIEPQDRLDALRAALEAVPPFSEAGARSHPFSAHMTIAEFIEPEHTQEIIEKLGPARISGRFTCSRVTWAVPDSSFHFQEHGQLRLGH